MADFEYSDDKKNELFDALYLGFVSVSKKTLPNNLYLETAKHLRTALYKGYGGTLLDFKFGEPDYKLLAELRENVYIFSAAKTATQVEDIKSLMFDGDRIKSLSEFKKLALQKFTTYNVGYLESEYITANTSGSSAVNWQYTQEHKALFTKLRSVVILDDLTAPECERMANVVAGVDDPIWNHNMPPRHFRCRCHVERIDKYEQEPVTDKSTRERIMMDNDETINPVFKMNPGKDGYVFSPKHAYFDIAKKFKVQARDNFGLKIPKTDEE